VLKSLTTIDLGKGQIADTTKKRDQSREELAALIANLTFDAN
jgi:hypothetical protein